MDSQQNKVIIEEPGEVHIQQLVDCTIKLAIESEDLHLVEAEMQASVRFLMKNNHLGFYRVALHPSNLDELRGMMIVWFEYNLYHPQNAWWIDTVYVQPNYRRQGCYKALYESVKQVAFQNHYSLKLYVDKHNQEAMDAYKKLGMRCCDEYKLWELDIRTQKLVFSQPQSKYEVVLAKEEDFDDILLFLSKSQSLLQFKVDANIETQLKYLLEKTKKSGSIIMTKEDGKIKLLTLPFTEYNEWCTGFYIWVYDFLIEEGTQDIEDLIKTTLYRIQDKTVRFCPLQIGIRIKFEKDRSQLLENLIEEMGFPISHYLVYETIENA